MVAYVICKLYSSIVGYVFIQGLCAIDLQDKGQEFLVLWIKPYCVTIYTRAIERYFHVVQFMTLCKVWSQVFSLWIRSQCVTVNRHVRLFHCTSQGCG